MDRLRPYDFRLPNDNPRLHHDFGDIVDWGVDGRLQVIKRQLSQVEERLGTEDNKKKKFVVP